MRKIDKIIVHCSDSAWGDAEAVRHWHTDPKPQGRGWKDIGYHAILLNGYRKNSTTLDRGANGLLEIGRPLQIAGAHCFGANANSIGICLIGKTYFTPEQYYKLRQLIDVWRDLYEISNAMIGGHRDFQATSGGKKKTCPNFDVQEFFFGKPEEE